MNRRFYDIHYHLFDLSHPNLLAFLMHEELISRNSVAKVLKKMPAALYLLPAGLLHFMKREITTRIRNYLRNDAANFRNLLSVMEGAIEYHFLYVEYFLIKENRFFGYSAHCRYNKLAVSPLLIDFGYKNLNNSDCFYNLPPGKPVANQVIDLLNAIYYYYNYDLVLHSDKPGRLMLIKSKRSKDSKLFEFYPFLGINTQNYDLSEIASLMDKYFRGYECDSSPEVRREKMLGKMGTVRLDMEEMIFHRREEDSSDFYSYIFAGIKLYPPLSFDPWPEDDRQELEKVRFLYSECVRRNLPLTVHCSDGGFNAVDDVAKFTDPSAGWKKVLSRPEFRKLKVNFAHLGREKGDRTLWLETIISYIDKNDNIYGDCSCQTPSLEDYRRIRKIIDSTKETNILFGSDFIISLLWSKSYNEYLGNFIRTPHLTAWQKKLMCEINPEKFLFG